LWGAPPFSGNTTLATLTFKAKTKGVATIKVDKSILVYECTMRIPYVPVDGTVKIVCPGDVNADGITDISDVYLIGLGFGALHITNQTSPKYCQYWHPTPCDQCPHSSDLDIIEDEIIDISDLYIAGLHFGEIGC